MVKLGAKGKTDKAGGGLIIGRSVVIHANEDDLVTQGDSDGNAGPIVAYGTIKLV